MKKYGGRYFAAPFFNFRASIQMAGNNNLKNAAMMSGMKALSIPTYPLELSFKIVSLGDETVEYGRRNNLPMLDITREWNTTAWKKVDEAMTSMRTFGWTPSLNLRKYIARLKEKQELANQNTYSTPEEWTGELETMFGDTFAWKNNMDLLHSKGAFITELVASGDPEWEPPNDGKAKDTYKKTYAKLVRWLPKTFPLPTGVGRALNDVATLCVMAYYPDMHHQIPDGSQNEKGEWEHPSYNSLVAKPDMFSAVMEAIHKMSSYLKTGTPVPEMIPDAIFEDGELDDVMATNLLIALRHRAMLEPPEIFTQVKTGDAYAVGYTPRGTVIDCQLIESNMDKRFPVVPV